MNLLEELSQEKKNLFQFYIIIGDGEKNRKVVSDFLDLEMEINLKSNFHIWKGDDFLIDIARDVKRENLISAGEDKKIIFLDFKKINIDTQNSLLKTFEDAAKNSHIFLFVPSQDFLLDTIKSRGRIIQGERVLDFSLAKDFFEGDFIKREKIIGKIDKNNIAVFMDSLENLIVESENLDRGFYEKFLYLKKYIFDKGISLKNILTWIAINLENR